MPAAGSRATSAGSGQSSNAAGTISTPGKRRACAGDGGQARAELDGHDLAAALGQVVEQGPRMPGRALS
jgi:hypothetical protein